MGFMQMLTVLFAIIATSRANHCNVQYSASLAGYYSCGKPATIDDCLSQLQGLNERSVKACYIIAGCSLDEAENETKFAIERCRQLSINELQRRDTTGSGPDNQITTADGDLSTDASSVDASSAGASSTDISSAETFSAEASSTEATSTQVSSAMSSATAISSTSVSSKVAPSTVPSSTIESSTKISSTLASRFSISMSGTACFTTTTKYIEVCDIHTTEGHTETATCSKAKSLSSRCAANRICTTNVKREDICMEKHGVGIEGVVVGGIFGAAIVVGFFYIFFTCFGASRKTKVIASKAKSTDTSLVPLIPKE
ncbi:hypothetical protein EDB81DRAFT_767242 [Dactylonectria macrodidyma]|uniref:Uncharacterized protein n=1 Tax=Dactylonectria macrodidyma TaxID=307937 RepID=A0A9P9DEF8_9HYPO|nr:hypothetical protein EDB81DRAFT_767242 [Dactylonectria macrodidyma]